MDWKQIPKYIVVGIPFIILLTFIVYPVISVVIRGLSSESGTEFLAVVTSPITQKTFSFTIIQALISTIITIVVGLPGAFLIARIDFRGRWLVRAAIVVPFVLPPIAVVVGFIQVFGPYGFFDSFFMLITGSNSSIINLAYGVSGILLAHVFYNIPLVILMVSSSLERLNPDLEESADILGASKMQKFRHVFLPHIKTSIMASGMLVFLFCFMSFPIVLALGNRGTMTMEVQIWNAFRNFDYGEASTLVLVQIIITMALALSYVRLTTNTQRNSGETRAIRRVRIGQLTPKERISSVLYLILLIILIAGPILSLGRASIYDPTTSSFTTRGFENLFVMGQGGGLIPLLNSLYYGGLATLLAIILGLPLAYAQRSKEKSLPSLSSLMTLLPLGISSITVAYGLMLMIAVPLGFSSNPWVIIIIAQTIIGLPFTVRAIEIALQNIDQHLLDQAEVLGASRLQKLFYVELPLLAPGILVGGVFAFAMAIGEMSATLFIALPQNITLSVLIYQLLGVRKFVEAGAAALILVVFCFFAFLIIEHMSTENTGGML
ncbi:MAG: ABC transporter permease subunit [Candidatus Lokiarchaeota archaeon]|nr:ABC transporter permease subunit [Candidatus Lokiarchaeota archaeon]